MNNSLFYYPDHMIYIGFVGFNILLDICYHWVTSLILIFMLLIIYCHLSNLLIVQNFMDCRLFEIKKKF